MSMETKIANRIKKYKTDVRTLILSKIDTKHYSQESLELIILAYQISHIKKLLKSIS